MIRTNSILPRDDGLCACGCNEPALPGRAFASESCRKRQLRRNWKKRENTITMSGYSPKRRAVEILDPMSDRHDWISLDEWKKNEQTYIEMGCKAIVKGQPVLI